MGYHSDIRYTLEKRKSAVTSASRSDGTDLSVQELAQETHDWMSSHTDEILLERSDFQVRLADTRGRRNKSSLLINRMYSWRGYKHREVSDLPHDLNEVTLQACQ